MSLEEEMATSLMTRRQMLSAILFSALCVIPVTATAIPYSYGFAAQAISNFSVAGGIIDSSSFSSLTSTSASVTGLPSDSHVDPTDAIQAFVGPPSSRPPENYFAPKGKVDADYARSDTVAAGAINNWDTVNVAESYLAAPTISMQTGEAEGNWGFEFEIILDGIDYLNFGFGFDQAIHIGLSNDALFPGSSVIAGLGFEVVLFNETSGDFASFRPSELNIELVAIDPTPGLGYESGGYYSFSLPAFSDGLWTVKVVGEEYVQTHLAKAPTPTTLALMGLGLVVFGFSRKGSVA
jgi:hypothetical protein